VAKDSLQSDRCAELLKALSEPVRQRMIDVLRAGPRNVGQIALSLENEVVNASHHLGILKNAGLVNRARQRRHSVYGLAKGVLEARANARARSHQPGLLPLELPKE
jgi:DNA-binding transcriptional ArsR family regulator